MSLLPSRKHSALPPAGVPSLSSLSAEYARLALRDRDLRSRLVAVDRELDQLRVGRAYVSSDARVAALVSGLEVAELEDNSADRRHDLEQERRDLAAAIDAVRNRLAAERTAASRLAWRDLAPVHKDKVGALCRALASALRAQKELHAFRAALSDADLSWGDQPQFTVDAVLGEPRDSQSFLRQLLGEAVRDKLVNAEDLADA